MWKKKFIRLSDRCYCIPDFIGSLTNAILDEITPNIQLVYVNQFIFRLFLCIWLNSLFSTNFLNARQTYHGPWYMDVQIEQFNCAFFKGKYSFIKLEHI